MKTAVSNTFYALALAAVLVGCGQPLDPSQTNNGTSDPNNGRVSNNGGLDSGGNGGDPDMGPARPAAALTVLTFNTQRFFDTVCDSGRCEPNDYEDQPSEAEFSFRADQIAAAIGGTDADVFLLQELESEACLVALQERLPGYDIRAFGEIGGAASLDVGLLARNASLIEVRKHRATTEFQLVNGSTRTFARELLEVHVDVQGNRVVLFNAHFKSKNNDNPEWRLMEARAAREIANATQAEFPDALVILGGDLNDPPDSPPLDALTNGDGFEIVIEVLDPEDRWTYAYFDDKQAIDHLLFFDTDEAILARDTVEVLRNSGGSFGGSDHAALKAEFSIFLD